jgi:surface antigen
MQSLQRSLATACLLVGLNLPIAAHAGGIEELRDPQGRLLGKVINRHDGLKEARSASNQLLGRYDPESNETRSASNMLFGRGNQLAVLIYSSSRTAQQAESQRPSMTTSVQPSQDRPRQTLDGNRGVVLPEVAARWARTTSAATAEDRRLAIEAFQRAGEAPGSEQVWQNPSSGNSGSIILHPDQKTSDTYYHGKLIPCFYGRMVLNAGGETDVQRQLVCKLMHNGVWTTVQVETE